MVYAGFGRWKIKQEVPFGHFLRKNFFKNLLFLKNLNLYAAFLRDDLCLQVGGFPIGKKRGVGVHGRLAVVKVGTVVFDEDTTIVAVCILTLQHVSCGQYHFLRFFDFLGVDTGADDFTVKIGTGSGAAEFNHADVTGMPRNKLGTCNSDINFHK